MYGQVCKGSAVIAPSKDGWYQSMRFNVELCRTVQKYLPISGVRTAQRFSCSAPLVMLIWSAFHIAVGTGVT